MISDRHTHYMNLALTEALRSPMHRVKIGAVIVDGNYVVSKGFNLLSSHPMQYRYNTETGRVAEDHRCHAEVSALVRSKQYPLVDCDMFIGRRDKTGHLAQCRPCVACYRAIRDAGISRIFYTTPSGIQREHIS